MGHFCIFAASNVGFAIAVPMLHNMAVQIQWVPKSRRQRLLEGVAEMRYCKTYTLRLNS